jgi:hypothetical protein
LNESLVSFGCERHLTGVLLQPGQPSSTVGVLLFNSGVIHRVGAHRLNVKWARALGADGHLSLRFDLSGQGDSLMPQRPLPRAQQVQDDLRHAVDELGRAGARRVVIIGICSAAMHGLAAAQRDERIGGLLMIDGHAYPTWRTPWYYHWRRISARGVADNWRAAWRSLVAARQVRAAEQADAGDADPVAQPTREAFAESLRLLARRGVSVRMIYTATWSRFYSYPAQFQDVFGAEPFARQVEVLFAPHVDHTLTPLAAQAEVTALARAWLREAALQA